VRAVAAGIRGVDAHRLFAWLEGHRVAVWLSAAGAQVRSLVRVVAHHTGLPVVVVSAIAIALSWRLFRQSVRFAFEVLVAAAGLLVATRLGWIRW
jgi:hypothetical protein